LLDKVGEFSHIVKTPYARPVTLEHSAASLYDLALPRHIHAGALQPQIEATYECLRRVNQNASQAFDTSLRRRRRIAAL